MPFDNLVKRIHLASGSAAPIPNGPPDAFFASWLAHGTGGTCWPSAGALHALLVTLGFDARRGSAAMYDDRTGPIHTHGTTLVRVDGTDYWVDSSMLTNVPLPLVPDDSTTHRRSARARAVRAGRRSLARLVDHASPAERDRLPPPRRRRRPPRTTSARYEASRDVSPFNTALYATRNTDGRAGEPARRDARFERTAAGITSAPMGDDRERVLIEEFGYSEEIVGRAQLADELVPPPG